MCDSCGLRYLCGHSETGAGDRRCGRRVWMGPPKARADATRRIFRERRLRSARPSSAKPCMNSQASKPARPVPNQSMASSGSATIQTRMASETMTRQNMAIKATASRITPTTKKAPSMVPIYCVGRQSRPHLARGRSHCGDFGPLLLRARCGGWGGRRLPSPPACPTRLMMGTCDPPVRRAIGLCTNGSAKSWRVGGAYRSRAAIGRCRNRVRTR